MTLATRSQEVLPDYLAPCLETRLPSPSQGPCLKMRLSITVLCGTATISRLGSETKTTGSVHSLLLISPISCSQRLRIVSVGPGGLLSMAPEEAFKSTVEASKCFIFNPLLYDNNVFIKANQTHTIFHQAKASLYIFVSTG